MVEYVYDPLGRRIAKKLDGTIVEKYLWGGATQLLAVYDGANELTMRFEYTGQRLPIAMMDYRSGSSVRYYLAYDQVGSLIGLVTSGGQVLPASYTSFGRPLSTPLAVRLGFAGGFWDEDTQLVRFGLRDYDPSTGRWTARDPIGFAGEDTNLYTYVFNGPTYKVDSLGLSAYGFPTNFREALNDVGDMFSRLPGRMYDDSVGVAAENIYYGGTYSGLLKGGQYYRNFAGDEVYTPITTSTMIGGSFDLYLGEPGLMEVTWGGRHLGVGVTSPPDGGLMPSVGVHLGGALVSMAPLSLTVSRSFEELTGLETNETSNLFGKR